MGVSSGGKKKKTQLFDKKGGGVEGLGETIKKKKYWDMKYFLTTTEKEGEKGGSL